MTESKNYPPINLSDVRSGAALIDIGKNVSLRLVSDRRCFIKVTKQDEVALTPNRDVVDLQIIPEDKALQICCILGYSDEEMLDLIRRRSEQVSADNTADGETDDISSSENSSS